MRFFKRNSSKDLRPSNRVEMNSQAVASSALSEDGADSTRFAYGIGSGMFALSQEDEDSRSVLSQAVASSEQTQRDRASYADEDMLKQHTFMPFAADRPFQYQDPEADNTLPQSQSTEASSLHEDASYQAEPSFSFPNAQTVTQPFSFQEYPAALVEEQPFSYQDPSASLVEERPFSYQAESTSQIDPEFAGSAEEQSKSELDSSSSTLQQDNILSSQQAESGLENLGGAFTAQDSELAEQDSVASLQEGMTAVQDEHEQAIQLVAKMMLGSPLANLTADTNDELEQGVDFSLLHTVQEQADDSLDGLNTKATAFSTSQEEGDLNLAQALSAADKEQDLVLLDENMLANRANLNAAAVSFIENTADLPSTNSQTAEAFNTENLAAENSDAETLAESSTAETLLAENSNAEVSNEKMLADAEDQDNAGSQNEEFLVNRHLFEPKHKIELVSERDGEDSGPRVTFLDAESEQLAALAEQREDAILQAFVGPVEPNAPQSRTPSFMLLNTHANITLQELREQEQEEHLLSKEQKKLGNEADIHDFITGNIVSLSTGTDNVAVPIASGGAEAGSKLEDESDLTQDQVQGDRIEIKSPLDDDANYASTISSFTGNLFSPKLLPTLAQDIGRYFYVYALAIVFGVLCLMKVYQVQDTRNLTSQLNEVTVNNEELEKEWLNLLATRQNLSEHAKVRSYASFQLQMISPKTESEQVISLH